MSSSSGVATDSGIGGGLLCRRANQPLDIGASEPELPVRQGDRGQLAFLGEPPCPAGWVDKDAVDISRCQQLGHASKYATALGGVNGQLPGSVAVGMSRSEST